MVLEDGTKEHDTLHKSLELAALPADSESLVEIDSWSWGLYSSEIMAEYQRRSCHTL